MRTLNIAFLLAVFSSNCEAADEHFLNVHPPAFVQMALQNAAEPNVGPAGLENIRMQLVENIRNFFAQPNYIESNNLQNLAFSVMNPNNGNIILGMGEDLRRFMQSNLLHLEQDNNNAPLYVKNAARQILQNPGYNIADNPAEIEAIMNAINTLYQ